jgi:hypothetical protein
VRGFDHSRQFCFNRSRVAADPALFGGAVCERRPALLDHSCENGAVARSSVLDIERRWAI